MRKWRWQETDRRPEGQRDYGKEPKSACKPNTVFCSRGTKETGTNISVSSERRRCVVGRDLGEGSGRGQFSSDITAFTEQTIRNLRIAGLMVGAGFETETC